MQADHIFSLIDQEGLARRKEFIQIGIPIPSGLFNDAREIHLITETNDILPSERIPTAFWPDNSIKWCLFKFLISLDAHENRKVFLRSNKQVIASKRGSQIFENPEIIRVKTKNYCFQFSKKHFTLFDKITKDELSIAGKGFCSLVKQDGNTLVPVILNYEHRTAFTEYSQLYSELCITGEFQDSLVPTSVPTEAVFEAKLTFYYATDTVNYSLSIRNPRRAIHPSGLWDLGDANSLFLKDLSLGFEKTGKPNIQWKAEQNEDWNILVGDELNIYQESSGGKNWNSPNHKNKDNKVPLKLKGYIIQCDNKTEHGSRASPVISIGNNTETINVFIKKFWQNFPKALGVSRNIAKIGLFPEQFPDNIELQPGEKKTQDFYLNIGKQVDDFVWVSSPITIKLNPEWLKHCRVFPHLSLDFDDDPIKKIIQEGLTSTNNFFAKREAVDEYGWRNFGDLYADHETDFYKGNKIFVSHFNNQYDPIYGFLFQYALTGESQWFELADDLAKHVADIDIYQVDSDKEELNGGLFWHTDHYLDAATSTHRTFSKHHQDPTYETHTSGGGPGGQHCYTTGLLYHYLLTGSESSKRSIFQLCHWITKVYEGSDSILEILKSIKNRNQTGQKNIFTGKYPLDRGTGNYINALLDKFTLTRQKSALQHIEFIIMHTVHPLDDLRPLNLKDVETNWYYTVFFQSICRYLQTKEELSELDHEFYYARDTLLHYASWMEKNEYPYLEKPENLEFPNHTWTAQDLRKVNVLLYAAHYSSQGQAEYLDKAKIIHQYIVDNLTNESTRTYTRILSILMQCYCPKAALNKVESGQSFASIKTYKPLKKISKATVMMNIIVGFLGAMKHLSLKREINWLCLRSEIIQRFFDKY